MIGLTPMQAKCFAEIKRLTRDDMAPSFEELRLAMGVASKSTVHRLVHGLVERGAISFPAGRQRAIQVRGFEFDGLEGHTSDYLAALRGRIDEILKGRAQ